MSDKTSKEGADESDVSSKEQGSSEAAGEISRTGKSPEKKEDSDKLMNTLQALLSQGLNISKPDRPKVEQVLDEVSFDGIIKYMKSGKRKKIVVMVGAGISTSAGIPDFRSPGSGIYNNLQKYNLPTPECMFDIGFFKKSPEPFYDLAKELFPGKFKPTPCHYFLRLLDEKGLLTRLYTQNIDTLERVAGVPEDKLVEAHGTFYTSHCIKSSCKKVYSLEWMRDEIFSDKIPKCTVCGSTIKPDIVFFGERLPPHFFRCAKADFKDCDLLIIIGTSLMVQPFAGLVDNVPQETPRLLVNKEKCGQSNAYATMMGYSEGLDFDSEDNYRDVAWLGLCDDGCQEMANALGWGDELLALVKKEHERIDNEMESVLLKGAKKN